MMQKLLYTFTLTCCALLAGAQDKKPLRFRTTWGIFLSDTLPRPEVLKLLDSALVVRDGGNKKFPVVSFDFTYEKREAYVNDTTNQPGVYTESIGETFRGDKLSPIWSSRLKEMISKGEVLFFNNIVVRYAEDKFYRAPAVRITVN